MLFANVSWYLETSAKAFYLNRIYIPVTTVVMWVGWGGGGVGDIVKEGRVSVGCVWGEWYL